MEEQIAELRFSAAIEAYDFAIEYNRFGIDFSGDGIVQGRLGDRIRKLRKNREWTQIRDGRKSRHQPQFLADVERGKHGLLLLRSRRYLSPGP